MSVLFAPTLQTLQSGAVEVRGELLRRLLANYDRLERVDYLPELAFEREEDSWPGDWAGRNLLAWANLAQATGREPRYLQRLVEMLDEHRNARGYIGDVIDGFDEQQLSGHGWLVSGLLASAESCGSGEALGMAERIVENLYQPLLGKFHTYPQISAGRTRTGGAAGSLVEVRDGWRLSSDIGCAFIALEGIIKAYRQFRQPWQKALAEEMFALFQQIDLAGISAQLHASLTAARQFLMLHDMHPDSAYLQRAAEVYGLFRSEAITENYANYNWFGRPTWTEPCAVVDALMVAFALWRKTGNPAYLDDVHYIYFNGLGYGQKPHGGFGCDSCAGAEDTLYNKVYDVTWCCNMRGGVGLAEASRYGYLVSATDVALPFYFDSTVHLTFPDGSMTLREETGYPANGWVNLTVEKTTVEQKKNLHFFVPGWIDPEAVVLKINHHRQMPRIENEFFTVQRYLQPGDRFELLFPVEMRTEMPINRLHGEGQIFRRGVLVLGQAVQEGVEDIPPSEASLVPLNAVFERAEEAQTERLRVMFRKR